MMYALFMFVCCHESSVIIIPVMPEKNLLLHALNMHKHTLSSQNNVTVQLFMSIPIPLFVGPH